MSPEPIMAAGFSACMLQNMYGQVKDEFPAGTLPGQFFSGEELVKACPISG
jgi:hypothetical protein